MGMLWVVLFLALTGSHIVYGLPVGSTPQTYPHDTNDPAYQRWGSDGGLYAVIPALALVLAAVGLLFGCTWCYRHKDCKPNEGADNQLFTASAAHLHEARRTQPPDSGFSEPVNNNISEDNNNGPISLREMQNIANNNAAEYIVSENEERNRVSRESVVEFEPLPNGIRVADPLEHCADWFGIDDFPRNNLQYLREIGRGWFGRVVEGEIEDSGTTTTVAVKILNQNASLEDKARFLDEARVYRDVRHENTLAFITKCLQEDPWILIFELCSTDLQQYLAVNRPKMAILNEGGVPLRLMCDVTSALTYLHSRGYLYGNLWSGNVLVRGTADSARAVLGRYGASDPQHDNSAPEARRHPPTYTASSEVWSLGTLIWEVCAWGSTPARHPPPLPDLPCPYRNHLYQVMQLCWNSNPDARPTSAQVYALLNHLYTTHTDASEPSQDDGYGSSDFEERWQRLKPNTIPKLDEHVAIIHAPSTSMASHFTGSDHDFDNTQTVQDTLSVDMDTAVSRSSSIMSDKDPLSVQIKSESLTNLHGSLEDVRNIYLTHNEMAVLECHQGNISLEESREKEQDRSDSSVDPWLKDIIAGSQDDVSYYKDVSDVIKNLDNILNSEKTSSSESSHQASPLRDNLSLDCKKDYPIQSNMVKSPGINNFQNILDTGFNTNLEVDEPFDDNDVDRDTVGTLSHSFERHSDTISQQTLENLTPETPIKDIDVIFKVETQIETEEHLEAANVVDKEVKSVHQDNVLPKDNKKVNSDNKIPKLKELCVVSMSSVSDKNEQLNLSKDCQTSCDNNITERTDIKEKTKSIVGIRESSEKISTPGEIRNTLGKLERVVKEHVDDEILLKSVIVTASSNIALDSPPAIELSPSKRPENEISDCHEAAVFGDVSLPKVNDKTIVKRDLIEVVNKYSKEPGQEILSVNKIKDTEISTLEKHASLSTVFLPETINSNFHEKSFGTNDSKQDEDPVYEVIIDNQAQHLEQCALVKEDNAVLVTIPLEQKSEHIDNETLGESILSTEETKYKDPVHEITSVVNNEIEDGCMMKQKQISESIFPELKPKSLLNIDNQLFDKTISDQVVELKHFSHETFIEIEKNLQAKMENFDAGPSSPKPKSETLRTDESGTSNNSKVVDHECTFQEIIRGETEKTVVDNEDAIIPASVSVELDLERSIDFNYKDPFHETIIGDSATATENVIENEKLFVPALMPVQLGLKQNVDENLMAPLHETINGNSTSNIQKTVVENEGDVTPASVSVEYEIEQSVEVDCKTPFHERIGESSATKEKKKIVENKTVVAPLVALESEIHIHSEIPNKIKVLTEKAEGGTAKKNETDIENSEVCKNYVELVSIPPKQTEPELVQIIHSENSDPSEMNSSKEPESVLAARKSLMPGLPSDKVQNIDKESVFETEDRLDNKGGNDTASTPGSDYVVIELTEQSNDSTVYMDLINGTNKTLKNNTLDDNVKDVIKSCLDSASAENSYSLVKNESTVYLDLPSLITKETENFLHMERMNSSKNTDVIVASTPIGSDNSADNFSNTLDNSVKENETEILSETKVPESGPGAMLTKLEQTFVPDNMSPFESPTKSHHTDTFDENSSVVLGPFENCSLELFRVVKSTELIDLPKEELLAFSSNFSEINLETPSPLRDGNFLNEVPDIVHDDLQFDDITSVSEVKTGDTEPQSSVNEAKGEQSEPPTASNTDESGQSVTEKHISPLTPPNSPGIFLASTSQQKYLVDIDLNTTETVSKPNNALQNEIDLNQIELQITSKLAMAENENNLNIEYSGPLTVEGRVDERESDAIPESYLAGNGGSLEDVREGLTLDEECVQALRNELELKLPLAQVAAIEPQCENEWSPELPPPPELVVSYPGALSPIAEETGQQLCAYENDANWNTSTRTDSSESYPEPCNNSTDEVTDLPTGAHGAPHDHSTYTVHSKEHSPNNTYTVQKDVGSSKELTMSADSLNASPYKIRTDDTESPVDDRTYNKKDEEKESNCERISQISPFLLSPTTDTSAPENSDNFDNATGVSTLSKTTLPTDAKLSKPSECLSKATSIDSWCSNDTLYNVEENFDDLAMDPDLPTEFAPEKEEGNSDSTDTLTHNDDEKEHSHCSTYIIHDSKSEACETFSPDSITANDNNTYTKAKTEAATTSPSVVTKSEVNDSPKNSLTIDLAYGTLISGLPSYSNCTTEVASGIDAAWKLPQPELVRKSPIGDNVDLTPPKLAEEEKLENSSPQLTSEPRVKKMDSVEISCLQDNIVDSHEKTESSESQALLVDINESPTNNYRNNMAPSITSTPLTELGADADNVEAIPMQLPQSPEYMVNIPNFQTFQQSAEVRPQDLSSNASNECVTTEILLEGDSRTLSRNSNRDSLVISERTPTYSDFENSAVAKPQDVNSRDKSSQSIESGISSEGFRQFENSVRNCPQDLSSMIDASSLLLKNERISSELAMGSFNNDQNGQSGSRMNEPMQSLNISPPNITNLIESHCLVNVRGPTHTFLINFDPDDELEQPHSIIVTETPFDVYRENSNVTFDSHAETKLSDLNHTYDSHASQYQPENDSEIMLHSKINGDAKLEGDLVIQHNTVTEITKDSPKNLEPTIVNDVPFKNDVPNGSPATDKRMEKTVKSIKHHENSEMYATVNFLNETFEELIESNVDDGDVKDMKTEDEETSGPEIVEDITVEHKHINDRILESKESTSNAGKEELHEDAKTNGEAEVEDEKMTSVTEDFLLNEKKFCQLDSYLPLMSDIRFTGPGTEIMSTSFTQDSPTDSTSPECEQDSKPAAAADIIKEWDSDSDSHSTNSSSGEFIWKDGDGHETSVVPSTHFDHQRDNGSQSGEADIGDRASEGGALSEGSGDSGSGSEGDEVEFVPSSWDCRAAPAKSSLRSLEQAPPDSKKRVVFKRQKYHCVYEYPREASDADAHSPAAYLPDLSTYCEWDPTSAEEAELGYGQLFGAPSPLDMYPLRGGIAFGADYDEDFFISSSARPFESLGIMSTTSQFFPGMHVKPSILERDLSDDVTDEFPPPPSPLPTTLVQTRTPSLDFTTPDSGVEDITPGSTIDEDFKAKKLPENELTWRPIDSASSSESVSPSSPGGEALGGLRHTRDKLKLDLPPSPHIPSPRHNRVFNFVLDKPKRRSQETPSEISSTPLVMTDDTPIVTTSLPLQKECEETPAPEPTFSTFGKSVQKLEPEQQIVLTDNVENDEEVKEESPKVVEAVKGEGTVLDSGDEDSGIESSSKATLERNKTSNVS